MAERQLKPASGVYQCNSCEGEFDANDFYVSNASTCKECVKARVRANREDKADYYRAYDRKRYRDSPERKATCRANGAKARVNFDLLAYNREKRAREPEKYLARNAVNNALRDGRIERKPCFFCGADHRLQAHHEDYDHPLDVVWLCAGCHGKLHSIRGDLRRAKA